MPETVVHPPELIARVTPFAAPGETVIGAFRALRGPRPGAEALALVVNVPLLAFAPGAIISTLLIGAGLGVGVLVLVAVLRQRVLCAVVDDGILVLRCGRIPGSWQPQARIDRGGWDLVTMTSNQLGPRTTIGTVTYWIATADLAEVRRLARWIARED